MYNNGDLFDLCVCVSLHYLLKYLIVGGRNRGIHSCPYFFVGDGVDMWYENEQRHYGHMAQTYGQVVISNGVMKIYAILLWRHGIICEI